MHILIYLYIGILCSLSDTTTVRVSKGTLEMLERLRDKLKVGSLDETIQALIRQQRKILIESALGVDRGRIRPFNEGDRGEDRS